MVVGGKRMETQKENRTEKRDLLKTVLVENGMTRLEKRSKYEKHIRLLYNISIKN